MNYKELFLQKKICVLIPTFNNAQTLEGVLKEVLHYTHQIIIINDGSTDNTAQILSRYQHVRVIGYDKNVGKGYALRQGLKAAFNQGYHYAISIDSDGQHYPDDLPKFVTKLKDHPAAIIIGARNMDQASVPGKSSFGNRFSNFWFKFETGLKMSDTQSGYRLYPVVPLNDIKFFTRKYEFEIEVLVRSAWKGIEITEVPVKVFYAPKEKRISHFRPFRDFSRISVLNTILVTITLLYIKPRDFFRSFRRKDFWTSLRLMLFDPNESDELKAISVAFGVFMGIVPIWGFQLLVAIPTAIVLKMNKALVILAANISIPPMIPLILFLSHVMGAIWMGDDAVKISFDRDISLAFFSDSFKQYVLGAITLAIGASVIFGLTTYIALKLFRRR
jgi:glycosyltransferase involved in cell wall biosynthesis